MTGIDPLDPRFPVDFSTGPCPEFWRALRPWETYSPASAAFAAAEAARAVQQAMTPQEVFIRRLPPPDDLPAVEFVPRPRVYPALSEATLAAEFEPLEPLTGLTPCGLFSDCCHVTAVVSLHRRWRRDIYRCSRCLRICGVRGSA